MCRIPATGRATILLWPIATLAMVFHRSALRSERSISRPILMLRLTNAIRLVNRKTCASVAWSINIKDFIIVGNAKKEINEDDEKILSDVCEALVGAVFVDSGYNYAKKFVLNIWKVHINKSDVTILDSKTKLQEHSLRLYKKLPIYKLVNLKGPKHNPIFKISVTINKTKTFIGQGNSKKNAEQNAADNLLKSINII